MKGISRAKLIVLQPSKQAGGGGGSGGGSGSAATPISTLLGSHPCFWLVVFASFFTFASFLAFLTTTAAWDPRLSSSATQSDRASSSFRYNRRLPDPVFEALVNYAAASNSSGKMGDADLRTIAAVLRRRAPCNFLVFGLGHETPLWRALNHGGRTVFLEEDRKWIETIRQELPNLEAYHVEYDTKVSQAEELLELGQLPECTTVGDVRLSKCRLALKGLPEEFFEVEWDLIMVDAPTGYFPGAPGRMGAIYTAGMAARWRKEGETDVFVHDVNRFAEDRFSRKFLCEGYMREEEGFLRHFTIPSHRGATAMPFCPN